MSASSPSDSALVNIARCPEHGLHGERTECFVCGGEVEQVPMVPASTLVDAARRNAELHGALRKAAAALDAIGAKITPGMKAGTGEAKAMADGHATDAWRALAR